MQQSQYARAKEKRAEHQSIAPTKQFQCKFVILISKKSSAYEFMRWKFYGSRALEHLQSTVRPIYVSGPSAKFNRLHWISNKLRREIKRRRNREKETTRSFSVTGQWMHSVKTIYQPSRKIVNWIAIGCALQIFISILIPSNRKLASGNVAARTKKDIVP